MKNQRRLLPSPAALILLCCCLLSCTVVASSVTVAVGPAGGAPGSQVEVPVNIRGAKQLGYMQMELTYDPAVLEAATNTSGAGVVKGNLPKDVSIDSTVIAPGRLRLGMNISNQSESVDGDGTLMKALFKVKGGKGKECALALENVEAWDNTRPDQRGMEMLVTVENGKFTVGGGLPLWMMIVGGAVLLLLLLIVAFRKRGARTPAQPPLPVPRAASVSPLAAVVQNCPACHAPMAAGAKFCAACGTPVPAGPPGKGASG